MDDPWLPSPPVLVRYRTRTIGPAELTFIQATIAVHAAEGRTRISEVLCAAWDWRQPNGHLKESACRGLLLRLEERGYLILPPRRRAPDGPCQQDRLAPPPPPGPPLTAAALGTLAWGAAAYRNAPREAYLGWDTPTKRARLPLVAQHTRFLLLPWVRVPHLASKVLAANCRRLSADWLARYGHGLRRGPRGRGAAGSGPAGRDRPALYPVAPGPRRDPGPGELPPLRGSAAPPGRGPALAGEPVSPHPDRGDVPGDPHPGARPVDLRAGRGDGADQQRRRAGAPGPGSCGARGASAATGRPGAGSRNGC